MTSAFTILPCLIIDDRDWFGDAAALNYKSDIFATTVLVDLKGLYERSLGRMVNAKANIS